MNTTYILLAATVLVALFYRARKFIATGMIISAIAGLYQGIVTPIAIVALSGFAYLAFLFNRLNKYPIWFRGLFLILILILTAGFSFHMVPGFHNLLVINKLKVSDISCPFSMYLNFDKVMVGLILFMFSSLPESEKGIDCKTIKTSLMTLFLCLTLLAITSYLSGYVKPDFKIPEVTLLWMINNFFFICFAEEAIFRGTIQKFLKDIFSQYKNLAYNRGLLWLCL
jgi:membrane protease YdiL (CAAX protease family)